MAVTFFQSLVSGAALGLIYGLPALAIVLLFNTANFFNLAQGEMMMISTYILYQLHFVAGVGIIPTLIITLLIMVGMGFLINTAIFAPLRRMKARELFVLIITIALGIFLKNFCLLVWGSTPVSAASIWPSQSIYILGLRFMPSTLIILGVSVILIIFLYIIQNRTKFGTAMRAASENKTAASLMGIRVNLVIGESFALSLFITAVAGVLSTSTLYIYPEMADTVALKAFAATIIGGFGNPVGAIIGGLVIGIVETFVSFVIPATVKDGIVFVILIAFLLFKPTGLFKTENTSKL